MNAPGKKLKSKRKKRKLSPRMTFGELIRKLLKPESEEPEPKVGPEKQKKPTTKGKRVRKS